LEALYPRALAAEPLRPSRAVLRLRRSDLHATRLALTIQVEGRESEVTLIEEGFVEISVDDVPPGTFSPPSASPSPAAAPVATPAAGTPIASIALEVRVAELLDRLQGDDQLSVERLPDRRLRVLGLVASAAKRQQVVAGVERLSANGAVEIEIATHSEALRRARSTAGAASEERTRLEIRELPSGPPAIAVNLAQHLAADAVTDVIRDLSPRVIAEARAARLHAAALHAFLARFPEADAAALDADARQAWRAVLSRRVATCTAALRALDALLAPYFASDRDEALTAPASVTEAARRLLNETSVLDAAVTAAFTARDVSAAPAPEVSTDFRRHVHQASNDAFFIDGYIRP
jgi:hypothetical protein